ncbi:DUF4294 domain-containing protein [Flavobacterium sp. ST-75]|uniref:DUF4294 domain-containing protein n=1 Tax=Flavobacterium rhizophilum TaxID=3163296 RepID=A0ABW8Y9X8_9FLAO
MRAQFSIILVLFSLLSCFSQEVVQDTIKKGVVNQVENDSIAFEYDLEEMVISNVDDTVSAEQKKRLLILKRRVLKVYPYAKIAADRLTMLNANMEKLKTDKERKKYAKIVENYLENEFEDQLKKLSRKDGQILVKLIHRQTGESTFNLIKEHKSGWKAFWSSRIAKMFDIDLKREYSPATVAEDYYIEGYLLQAFDSHRLARQEPAFEIDYDTITQLWKNKNKVNN